jgi:hypothetical protein
MAGLVVVLIKATIMIKGTVRVLRRLPGRRRLSQRRPPIAPGGLSVRRRIAGFVVVAVVVEDEGVVVVAVVVVVAGGGVPVPVGVSCSGVVTLITPNNVAEVARLVVVLIRATIKIRIRVRVLRGLPVRRRLSQ